MKIPKYWAQQVRPAQGPDGKRFRLSAWRWSDTSTDEAKDLAQARVVDLVARVTRGETLDRYSYGDRPLREETIQSLPGAGGKELGVITRNGYGALVLNAAQAMFVDVDFQEDAPGVRLASQIRKLVGQGGKAAPTQEVREVDNIRQWAARNPGLGIRVYRTAGGLRGLITNQVFNPSDPDAQGILKELNGDPLYVKLCRDQDCFRARLSPKPWRCGIGNPAWRFPFQDAATESKFRAWEEKYKVASTKYAVCRLVAQIGSTEVIPDIEPVLSAHDQWCRPESKLQLA